MKYAVLLGIILITAPLLVRAPSPDPWPDGRSYETNMRAEAVRDGAAHGFDPTAYVFAYIPPQLALILLASITLIVLSMTIESEVFIAILASTPSFIVTFTRADEAAIGATIIALGVFLLSRRQYWAVALVPLAFALSLEIGILMSIALIMTAIAVRKPFIALGVSFFALISSMIVVVFANGTVIDVLNQNALHASILGERGGITIFLAILAICGVVMRYIGERDATHLLVLVAIPCIAIFRHGDIMLAGISAIYAAAAWDTLVSRRWHFAELRTLTLLLFVCGILFATIVTVRERATPDQDRIAFVEFVTHAYPQGTAIAAEGETASLLRAKGFVTGLPALPDDPSFIASTLRESGFSYIATRNDNPPYSHFRLVYKESSPMTYSIYEVPRA